MCPNVSLRPLHPRAGPGLMTPSQREERGHVETTALEGTVQLPEQGQRRAQERGELSSGGLQGRVAASFKRDRGKQADVTSSPRALTGVDPGPFIPSAFPPSHPPFLISFLLFFHSHAGGERPTVCTYNLRTEPERTGDVFSQSHWK